MSAGAVHLGARCAFCGGPLPPPAPTGRPRKFCSDRCRVGSHREKVVEFTVADVAGALVSRPGVGERPIGAKFALELLVGREGFVELGLAERVNSHFALTKAGREAALAWANVAVTR